MTEINYTLDAYPASSVVDGIYYNENTKELFVDLDDSVYAYPDVPVDEFHTFVSASSAGRHYGTYIKRTYGPGVFLGDWEDLDFKRVSKPASLSVGTPKGLYVSDNTNTSTSAVTNVTNTFTLNPAVSDPNLRKHEVNFAVDGKDRTHTLKVASVDEAVKAVQEIADMLDLTFEVTSVTVYFD